MKKKRIAAALTAIVMSVSVLSFNKLTMTEPRTSETVKVSDDKTPDMDVTATNSVGKYITQISMQEEQARTTALEDYKGNFSIADLTLNPESGIAIVKTTQSVDCTIVLRIVDEDDNSNQIVTEQLIQAGNDVVTEIKLNTIGLPEYYLVTADLIGLMDAPLCPTYTFCDYTREMQEIYAADVNDFEPEYVVNFDDDESTNFLVLNEATIIAESSDDVNALVSADYDNGIYVFDHVDDKIESLTQGDYFFIYASETDAIAISVDNVVIEGNSDGSVDSNIIVMDTTGNSIHACNTCIDGDMAFIIEGNVSLKLLVMKAKANVLKVNIPLGDWYWSDQLGFGWGTCPNLAYKVSFNVHDANGNPLSQMNVSLNYGNSRTTNSSGNTYFFCNVSVTYRHNYNFLICPRIKRGHCVCR